MLQVKFSANFLHLVVMLGLVLSPLHRGQGIAQESADKTSVGQDDSVAATNALAIQYYQGDGIPKNYGKAAELFLIAAGRGSALAQFNVGYMYEKGIGLPSDYRKAYIFYHAAARRGYRAALEPLENLRHFMSAEKIAEIENVPPPGNAASPEAPHLTDQTPGTDQSELHSWLQSIKPAAGEKKVER